MIFLLVIKFCFWLFLVGFVYFLICLFVCVIILKIFFIWCVFVCFLVGKSMWSWWLFMLLFSFMWIVNCLLCLFSVNFVVILNVVKFFECFDCWLGCYIRWCFFFVKVEFVFFGILILWFILIVLLSLFFCSIWIVGLEWSVFICKLLLVFLNIYLLLMLFVFLYVLIFVIFIVFFLFKIVYVLFVVIFIFKKWFFKNKFCVWFVDLFIKLIGCV